MKLVKYQFRRWLLDNLDETFNPKDACECPLARYAQHMTHRRADVNEATLSLYCIEVNVETCKEYSLPKWARIFVKRVDQEDESFNGRSALVMLDEKRHYADH